MLPTIRRSATAARARPLLAAALGVLVTACASPSGWSTTRAEAPAGVEQAAGAVTDHVLVVSIDGLRPEAIDRYRAPTLQRLVEEGAYSPAARTILPSRTLPSHTSMLTGEGPEEHGVTWNSYVAELGIVETPTIFARAHVEGLHTAGFFSKPKFSHLVQPGSLRHAQLPRGTRLTADRTVQAAVRYLDYHEPNLTFVHVADTDYAGHTAGWMTPMYGWSVRRVDRALADLLVQADRTFGRGAYTLIVTSDHGGHGRDHGTDDRRDVTIPWIAWGAGVAEGRLSADITTYDTAATVLWLLGVDVPADMAGRPVISAFSDRAQLRAEAAQAAAAAAPDPSGGR